MPQAKLPDINNAWVRYRNFGLQCIMERNYVGAIAAINEINALFPDAYRVEVNTLKYIQSTQDELVAKCTKCNEETNIAELHIFDLLLTTVNSIILNKETEKAWICKSCETINMREKTRMIRREHKKPNYDGVIAEPPKRVDGIQGRTEYHNNMVKWFYDALEELDHQLGKYRAEYKPAEWEEDANYQGDEDADRD